MLLSLTSINKDVENYTIREKNYKIKAFIVYLFSVIICLFYPMSKNGEVMSAVQTVVYYCIGCVPVILLLLWGNKVNLKSSCIGIFLLLYLGVASIFACSIFNTVFSIARFAPIAIAVFFFSLDIYKVPNRKATVATFEVITIIVLFTNLLIIVNNEFVNIFILKYYKQFLDYTVQIALLNKKPVFTFGVHTYAAFFYMLMFFLWYSTQKNDHTKRKRYYIYMISILICNILLISSTAFGFSVLMVGLLFMLAKKTSSKVAVGVICAIISIYFSSNQLIDKYIYMLNGESNGFLGRYASRVSLFKGNLEAINRCWLGIGYTIPRDVYFADSGFIVLFTIGNIVLPIIIYTMLWSFLKRNIPKNAKILFIIIMLFEFALSSLTYFKTILFMLFVVLYIKSLDEKNESKVH